MVRAIVVSYDPPTEAFPFPYLVIGNGKVYPPNAAELLVAFFEAACFWISLCHCSTTLNGRKLTHGLLFGEQMFSVIGWG